MATLSPHKKVIVVGGGWAGLSCAYELAQRGGYHITVLEAAPQCGGRARSIQWHALGIEVDNGQHILLGAYRAFLSVLEGVGLKESSLFERRPFEFLMTGTGTGKNKTAYFACKPRQYLSKKLSLLLDLNKAQGWTWAEKFQLGRFMARYVFGNMPVSDNLSALDLLKQAGQSQSLIQYFWEPILVAALSTPLSEACAHYAIRVLKDSFSGKPGSTDILIPKVPLGDIFANPITEWLTKKGHTVLCHQRATSLILSDSAEGNLSTHCIGVQIKDQAFYGKVVLALPPRAAQTLIQPIDRLQTLSHQLAQFTHEPIVTIYYAFPNPHPTCAKASVGRPTCAKASVGRPTCAKASVGRPTCAKASVGRPTCAKASVGRPALPNMQAIVQDDTHYWLFCRPLKEYLIFTAVFSGTGAQLAKDKNQIMYEIQKEIQARYPSLGTLVSRKYIQEKFAAFSADYLSHSLKPANQSALPGLWLCGDYTQGPYPATLEGAVLSGLTCAHVIPA